MLTVSWRRKRRVPPQRGRGAILGLFFCCAQCSTVTVVPSSNQGDPFGFFPKAASCHAEAHESRSILLFLPLAVTALACTNGKPRPTKAGASCVKFFSPCLGRGVVGLGSEPRIELRGYGDSPLPDKGVNLPLRNLDSPLNSITQSKQGGNHYRKRKSTLSRP
jgi:hypothetical protein